MIFNYLYHLSSFPSIFPYIFIYSYFLTLSAKKSLEANDIPVAMGTQHPDLDFLRSFSIQRNQDSLGKNG